MTDIGVGGGADTGKFITQRQIPKLCLVSDQALLAGTSLVLSGGP